MDDIYQWIEIKLWGEGLAGEIIAAFVCVQDFNIQKRRTIHSVAIEIQNIIQNIIQDIGIHNFCGSHLLYRNKELNC